MSKHAPFTRLKNFLRRELDSFEARGLRFSLHRKLNLAEYHALAHKLLKGLFRRHDAEVEQNLVPEACVEKVKNSVLCASNI